MGTGPPLVPKSNVVPGNPRLSVPWRGVIEGAPVPLSRAENDASPRTIASPHRTQEAAGSSPASSIPAALASSASGATPASRPKQQAARRRTWCCCHAKTGVPPSRRCELARAPKVLLDSQGATAAQKSDSSAMSGPWSSSGSSVARSITLWPVFWMTSPTPLRSMMLIAPLRVLVPATKSVTTV
jgi:hypothetical protein